MMQPSLGHRFASFALRALVAVAVLWTVITIPLPFARSDLLYVLRVPVCVFVFIVYLGKTLYDTFFFERPP